jgi:hypothetical protein
MFSWFKKKPNAGQQSQVNSEPAASISADQLATQRALTRILAGVFESAGERVVPHNDWLAHPASGLSFRPHLSSLENKPNGGVYTLTIVETYHPDLAGQPTIYEFQHSHHNDAETSFRSGFEQWRRLDFMVLTDVFAKDRPKNCVLMKMEFRAENGKPARTRNVLLGPIAHFRQKPLDGEEHPFCPCCLFSYSSAAFKEIVESPGLFAIRFYAFRDAAGVASVDCRINGKEFEPGKAELRKYVAKWPDAGLEFRKQYVIVHGRKYLDESGIKDSRPL